MGKKKVCFLHRYIALMLASMIWVSGCNEVKEISTPISTNSTHYEMVDLSHHSKSLSLVAVGDHLIHGAVYKAAYDPTKDDYEFSTMYASICPLIADYDIRYINFETLMAGEAYGYSGYPAFNGPSQGIDDLVDCGFNWMSLSSNHSFDKGAQAVHDTVVGFLAELRAGTASTKTRAEVAGSGKKPFKQKGLGRARAGSTRNPVWRHGGVAFGPKPRSFATKLNAKVKRLALKRSFSEKVKEGSVIVLENFDLQDYKTKNAVAVLKAFKAEAAKVLIAVKEYEDNQLRATGNLPLAILIKAASVNTYQVLYSDKLMFTKEALDEFVKRLA